MNGLVIVLIVLIAVIGVFLLLRFLRNVQPDEFEVEADLKELKAKIAQFKGGFMPWTDEISANEVDQVLTKDNTRTGSGVFLSTDGQPIFAFAFRKYIGPGRNAVVYILTLDHEYIFRITNKGTEITIDNEKQGILRENGILYDARNNEVAKVKRHGASGKNTILMGNKEVAKVALPDAVAAPRALELVEVDLQPKEQETIRTMAMYELVNNMEDFGV